MANINLPVWTFIPMVWDTLSYPLRNHVFSTENNKKLAFSDPPSPSTSDYVIYEWSLSHVHVHVHMWHSENKYIMYTLALTNLYQERLFMIASIFCWTLNVQPHSSIIIARVRLTLESLIFYAYFFCGSFDIWLH